MTTIDLLKRMHFNRPGVREPRKLVATPTGFDWHGRPERPIHPGTWIGEGDPGYYRFHRRESVPAELAAHMLALSAHENHPGHWPELPGKVVRRMIRHGWLAADADGLLAVTPLGRAAWHVERFGHPEGAEPPRSGRAQWSKKRRPQGERMTFSMYRWHVQGRNRKGSTPQPAPHVRLRWREALAAKEMP